MRPVGGSFRGDHPAAPPANRPIAVRRPAPGDPPSQATSFGSWLDRAK